MLHRGTMFCACRFAAAEVALEYLFFGSNLNGSKRAGFHAGKTPGTLLLVDNNSLGPPINLHRARDRARLLTACIPAMEADEGEVRMVLLGVKQFYPGHGRVHCACVLQ